MNSRKPSNLKEHCHNIVAVDIGGRSLAEESLPGAMSDLGISLKVQIILTSCFRLAWSREIVDYASAYHRNYRARRLLHG